jgi:hypothetical protein
MMLEEPEEAAIIGREYTKQKMPVWLWVMEARYPGDLHKSR